MSLQEEREKLYNEVWKEPIVTVAKRYGLSDNGLRKRCKKLSIPLPPSGYWAKLQAGKPVIDKPELLPLNIPKNFDSDLKRMNIDTNRIINYIDINILSNEELRELDGMDILTIQSKEKLLELCNQIKVPAKVTVYDSLIISHQGEMTYRRARDEEYKFKDRLFDMSRNHKIEYRNNTSIIPITVSDKHIDRAYRIIDTLIKALEKLHGEISVESRNGDYALIDLLGHKVSFTMFETKVKRRSLKSTASQEDKIKNFRPSYENIFSGMLTLEFSEVIHPWDKVNTPKVLFKCEESSDLPLEDQLGKIVIALCRLANSSIISKVIISRENEIKDREQKRLNEIKEENRRQLLQIEEHKRLRDNLLENIETHAEEWFKSKKLREYAEDLETFLTTINDKTKKELLSVYIKLVQQKIKEHDLIAGILNEVNDLTLKGLI